MPRYTEQDEARGDEERVREMAANFRDDARLLDGKDEAEATADADALEALLARANSAEQRAADEFEARINAEEGKREAEASVERLREALTLARMEREWLLGAWAGATGVPQAEAEAQFLAASAKWRDLAQARAALDSLAPGSASEQARGNRPGQDLPSARSGAGGQDDLALRNRSNPSDFADLRAALSRIEQELADNLTPEVADVCRSIARSALAGERHVLDPEWAERIIAYGGGQDDSAWDDQPIERYGPACPECGVRHHPDCEREARCDGDCIGWGCPVHDPGVGPRSRWPVRKPNS